ncbi:MAG: sigma-70 family RNA polymerase sigma factor [Ruminococcaceae bacterium]|nr:sigma-70 family RNA polymerase sigma factor [Oscillospiraceae bacterium]
MNQNEIKNTLLLIKQRKSEGFDILYNKYFRFMFGTAYSVLNNESDCYDVIQNVMLRLYTMEERLFPNDHEIAWLHTVVKNEALMHLRKEKKTVPLDEVQELPEQDLEIEDFVDIDAFDSMTASLNDKQKQIVSLKMLGGMTHKEISKIMSIPIGTVQWIYNTSIKKLRRALGAIACFILFFGAGFGYNLVKYISNAPEDGQMGSMEFDPEPAVISPWLIIFGALMLLSVAAFIIFLNFSDKLPTKRKRNRI